MSISSVLSPSTWASQILGTNPLATAAAGAGSFLSTLTHALQQAGSSAAASSGSAATATGAIHGHHHGHHGGGSLAAQLAAATTGTAAAPGIGRLLNTQA